MLNNETQRPARIENGDEVLLADERDGLGPVEMVQRRLNEMNGGLPWIAGQLVATTAGRRPERSV
ncbi:MAG: hypothetical protein ACJ8C4_07710 [Gemmataceae bacterium]